MRKASAARWRGVLGAAVLAAALAGPVRAEVIDLSEVCARDGAPAWDRRQEQDGTVSCADGVLWMEAGPKGSRVGKAALIVPIGRVGEGGRVRIAAEVWFPAESPLNSIILMDAECKFCGRDDNPGLRLYLRNGRLRVDRAKIGERHAWTNDSAPQLAAGAWVPVTWELDLSTGRFGRSVVRLGETVVLDDRGRTTPGEAAPMDAVDRVQIGITANSNPVPVQMAMRGIRIEVLAP